jgi:hypothetical protein
VLTRRVWGSLTRFVAALAAILLAQARAFGAQPPGIEQIRELGAEADFEASARLARERLASGALSRSEAAETYLELGIVETARGDTAAGNSALRRALKLEPALRLPDTAGPHVRQIFAEAVKWAPRERLFFSVSLSPAGAGRFAVSAQVKGDSDRIARKLLIEGEGVRRGYALESGGIRTTDRVEWGTEPCVILVATVLDEFNNRLWPAVATARVCASAQGQETLPAAPASLRPSDRTSPSQSATVGSGNRPVPTSVWIGATVTAGLVGITGLLGIIALDRRSEYHRARDDSAVDLRTRAEMHESAVRMADMATVAGAAAAAAGITTGVLYLTRPETPGARRLPPGASLSPSGLVVRGQF